MKILFDSTEVGNEDVIVISFVDGHNELILATLTPDSKNLTLKLVSKYDIQTSVNKIAKRNIVTVNFYPPEGA